MDSNSSPEKAPSPVEHDSAVPENTENLEQVPGNSDVPHAEEHPIGTLPAPLGQNSDAMEPDNVHKEPENEIKEPENGPGNEPTIEPTVQTGADANMEVELPVTQPEIHVSMDAADAAEERQEQEANSSFSNALPSSMRSFATPSKSLPPLKDIEHITTPKSFGVAKDDTHSQGTFKSSPVQMQNGSQLGHLAEAEEDAFDATANDTFANAVGAAQHNISSNATKSAEIEAAAAFLDVDPQALVSESQDFVAKIAQRAQKFSRLQSELSFFKLNQEQMNQVQSKKYNQLQKKLESLASTNESLLSENETSAMELSKKNDVISDLRTENSALLENIQKLENSIRELRNGSTSSQHEVIQLNESVTALTRANAEQGQKISELTREVNNTSNENFSHKLELSKVTNELSYTKNQKDWYESQLKSVQDKYTELIKRHESDTLKDSNKISSLVTQNETLTSLRETLKGQINDLEKRFEEASSLKSELETKLQLSSSRFAKESSLKDETIELLNIHLAEKNDRIAQLESYAEEIKASTAESVGSLQSELVEKEDKLAQVEERLRRAEEALDSELHKETKLPKLAPSAELILQESSSGISLSTLYTEFNHIKKELILEKSQKEKLASQLQHFIVELDSKKPAIANYRNQISYYEETLKEVLAKMESIRVEKIESEKECIRLRTRLASHETEIQTVKQLSKDLGRQLCFYLIHSKIREGNEDPLSSHEKRIIDQILAKTGNNDINDESDTDQLITERLIGFASIIDLQKKNEELTVAVRSLGKQLEEKDSEPNGFEAAAVEEAKEAILTLQSELESVTLKYDAVSRERDLIKSLNGNSMVSDESKVDLTVLREANNDLKTKIQDSEKALKQIQSQSEAKIRSLNETLSESRTNNEDLKSKITAAMHSVEISENRLENSKKLLENARKEIEQSQREISFWKSQASKQEDLLVKKSNELRDAERNLQSSMASQNNLQTEKEVWSSLQRSLMDEISRLKCDKDQLNSFVFNLQALLKERENSSSELSKQLTQSVENYQALQDKINEKEDKIQILSSQSDMALKAQNAKLEQVNELSQKLLEARSKVAEKQAVIENLKKEITAGGLRQPSARKAPQISTHTSAESGSPILASEYNDLKDALKVAEAQVSEFSSIAKSAEDALMKATESFDEFRESTNAKVSAMEGERSSLLKEVEEHQKQIEDLQNQLQSHDMQTSLQIRDLQTKLQQSSLKAESYDEMKSDYEKKLSSMGQDLSNQISVSDELQKRYDAKVSEAESLNLELVQQKQKVSQNNAQLEAITSKLETAEAELKEKEDRLTEYLSGQQDELQNAQIKLRDLQYQYDLVLTQIELQKPFSESEDPQSDDNFRQVITYLRAEKDSAESKAAIAADEVAQLKVQLDSVSAELKASKSQMSRLQSMKLELEDTNKDHDRLMEQLEQLNILRESNSTLRIENRNCLDKISELQSKIDSTSTTEPVNGTDLQADVHAQELKLLREENDRLKNQSNNNEELEKLRQRFEKLKSEFQAKLTNHRSKNKELERQLNEVKQQLEATQAQLSQSSTDNGGKTASLQAQLKQVESEKAEAEKKFTDEITKLKTDYEKHKADANSNFEAKLAQAKSSASASAGSTEVQIKEKLEGEWKQELDRAKSDLKKKFESDMEKAVEQRVQERLQTMKEEKPDQNLREAQDRLKKEYEAKISALHQSFEKQLASQKASTEKAVGTKYEFKLKVLTRKLEKYEKGKESTPSVQPNDENKNTLQSSFASQKTGPQNQAQSSAQTNSVVNVKDGETSVEGASGKPAASNDNDGAPGKKRPFSQGNPPSITFKRSKD